MDKRNSPKFSPDDMEMVGDKVGMELGKTLIYRTRISRSEHVRGDPFFDRAVLSTPKTASEKI